MTTEILGLIMGIIGGIVSIAVPFISFLRESRTKKLEKAIKNLCKLANSNINFYKLEQLLEAEIENLSIELGNPQKAMGIKKKFRKRVKEDVGSSTDSEMNKSIVFLTPDRVHELISDFL